MHVLVKLEIQTDSEMGLDDIESIKEGLHEALRNEFPAGLSWSILSCKTVDELLKSATCGCSTDDK